MVEEVVNPAVAYRACLLIGGDRTVGCGAEIRFTPPVGVESEIVEFVREPKVELPKGYVYPHITKIPGVCGGRPAIEHTRVRVLNIVYLLKEGDTPEAMLEQYDLNLAQVHAALAQRAPLFSGSL